MPYAGEHSCRLKPPGDFDKFRRKNCDQKHEDKCIDVIYGIKDGESEIQALRYKTDVWTESDARTHCDDRDGTFEPAAEENAMKGRERRTIDIEDIEIRAEGDEPKKIVGYAARFNVFSVPMWGFREKIAPGAFANSIQTDDVRFLWEHDSKYVLGRNTNGTLTMVEDEQGLRIEDVPPDTQWARDLMVSIERRDIDQMSFGFETIKDEWDRTDPDKPVRTLLEVKLFDVSVVTYPAYPQTSAKVRTAEEVYQDYIAAESQEDDAAKEAERKRVAQESARREREIQLQEVGL